jgi:glycosyltransferase involved in cell wall biosynthesis
VAGAGCVPGALVPSAVTFSLHIDTARSWRGGQNQVLLTVNGLRAAGHRAMLVAHPSGELRRRAEEGLELIPLAPDHELDLKAGWRLSRLLRRIRPDVIHAHDPHGVAMASVALSMSSANGGPRLVAGRRVDFRLKRNSFSRWKYRQVDLFIASSEAIRQILIRDGVEPGRVVTVHEGIDAGRMAHLGAANVHAEFFLPHGAPLIGNIAALVPHKGQKHLLDAMPLVVKEVPDARLVILGEGELRPQLEQQVKHLRLEHHVVMPGFRSDVLALLKGVDIFVLSSETEGLGTSLLDAMAAGKPCVGTRAGGIPEVIDEEVTGLLVPPHDPPALAVALIRLLEDVELRRRMGEAALVRVAEHFSVERMVDGTIEAYRAAIGGS